MLEWVALLSILALAEALARCSPLRGCASLAPYRPPFCFYARPAPVSYQSLTPAMTKRRFDPAVLEMMDRPQTVSAELERDLERIRQLNRWFGSYRLVLYFVREWLQPGARCRIVDLGTGSGDVPRLIVDFARSIGAHVEIDALDRQPATLEIARGLSAGYPEIHFREADIRYFESTEPYDLALNTMTLHHFSQSDAIEVLRKGRELSRKFVLVSDLRRGFLLQAGVYLLTTFIFREPMTRFDARLSAERAFSFAEMKEIARRSGWGDFGHKSFRCARQAIWLEKNVNE